MDRIQERRFPKMETKSRTILQFGSKGQYEDPKLCNRMHGSDWLGWEKQGRWICAQNHPWRNSRSKLSGQASGDTAELLYVAQNLNKSGLEFWRRIHKNNDPKTGIFWGYQVTIKNSNVQISVPLNEESTNYQEILEWAKIEGNTIQEAD